MSYQICSRCILDTSDETISFDKKGICRFCNQYDAGIGYNTNFAQNKSAQLDSLIEKIKHDGKDKEYDCIIGLSGGVDSSYIAYLVKKVYGLRPLAVHLDNGWNDELAVSNIENICKQLDIDLYTHVINWREFKDLQLSFLKASVANAEAPTDHAIFAILYDMAVKYKVKWIIDGGNIQTVFNRKEFSVAGYTYVDLKHIKAIHKIFGSLPLKTFPQLSYIRKFYLRKILGYNQISILNYIDYHKEDVKEFLKKELDWKEYGAKHHESLFTKWHQCVYLNRKFKWDKRRAHLSDLVLSGQITRDAALEEMKKPLLPPQALMELEQYVMKKFELSKVEYDAILNAPPVPFSKYPNQKWLIDFYHNKFRKNAH